MKTRFEDYGRWQNLVAMFLDKADEAPDAPMLWTKKDGAYRSTTRKEAREAALSVAAALKEIGVKKGDRVILLAESRSEWAICDFAIMAAGAFTVPAYTTNTEHDHLHVLDDSGAVAAIVSTAALAKRFFPAAAQSETCTNIIMMDGAPANVPQGFALHDYAQLVAANRDKADSVLSDIETIQRTDTACLIYTSGTGGAPKGVMLSHGAILANCAGAFDVCSQSGINDEVFLSFLPLSHSYEHTAGMMFPISIGAEVYYAEGVEKLAANLGEVRPTIMTSVPRLYEMLYRRITTTLEKDGGFKLKLFRKALDLGRKRYEGEPLGLFDWIADKVCEKLIRAKLRARFGGRLKYFVSGGGPLNYELGILFVSSGLTILQGYGQTEFAPVVSCNLPNNNKLRTVGPPMAGVEVSIAKDGEILLRGECTMSGYWNNPDATANTVIDGWLHTGDVGHLDEEGLLVITDRKKDIIVNSGGDNISPQRVEGLLTLETTISQAMVIGDKKPHLVALIIPDQDAIDTFKKEVNLPEAANDDILDNPDFVKKVQASISKVNSSLSNIEKVRKFTLAAEPFSVDNAMLTPSMKIRRHVIKEKYGEQLDSLYG